MAVLPTVPETNASLDSVRKGLGLFPREGQFADRAKIMEEQL
jgi:hypothetical protein